MRLFYDKYNAEENGVEDIAIKCSNYHISTGLYLNEICVKYSIS